MNRENDEAGETTAAQPSGPGAGLVIGPHHLLALIGESGMGETVTSGSFLQLREASA